MGLFLYYKVLCPNCNETFPLKKHQKAVHIVRIWSKKLLKCPHCRKWGMCKGLRAE